MKRFTLPVTALLLSQTVHAEFRQIDLTIFGMD